MRYIQLLVKFFSFFAADSSVHVNDFGPGMVIYNVHNRGDHTLDIMDSPDIALHIRYHVARNVTIFSFPQLHFMI